MDCPNCQIINPLTARRCDCGYDFLSQTMTPSAAVPPNSPPAAESRELLKLALVIAVIALSIRILNFFHLEWDLYITIVATQTTLIIGLAYGGDWLKKRIG